METKFKKHLGDHVYADYRDGYIILTTDCIWPKQVIYLDPEVVKELVNYLSALPEKIKEQTSKK
jgi:hypothetical protein